MLLVSVAISMTRFMLVGMIRSMLDLATISFTLNPTMSSTILNLEIVSTLARVKSLRAFRAMEMSFSISITVQILSRSKIFQRTKSTSMEVQSLESISPAMILSTSMDLTSRLTLAMALKLSILSKAKRLSMQNPAMMLSVLYLALDYILSAAMDLIRWNTTATQ